MNKNFKIILEYDGTNFFGWQKQTNKRTIQGKIEKILSRILNQKITITGSGRTDTGVHAFAQVANFHADTNILPTDIQKGFNSLIKPQEIVIKECDIVNKDFHAQYNAIAKEYHYHILNTKDPCAINRQYSWHIKQSLDIRAMNKCCKALIGVHDFASFENTGSTRTSSIREVFSFKVISLKCDKNRIVFKICAQGFLKGMVRNLIGTIVLTGLEKTSKKLKNAKRKNRITFLEFVKILKAKDRAKAGIKAPAQGLFLKKVFY